MNRAEHAQELRKSTPRFILKTKERLQESKEEETGQLPFAPGGSSPLYETLVFPIHFLSSMG